MSGVDCHCWTAKEHHFWQGWSGRRCNASQTWRGKGRELQERGEKRKSKFLLGRHLFLDTVADIVRDSATQWKHHGYWGQIQPDFENPGSATYLGLISEPILGCFLIDHESKIISHYHFKLFSLFRDCSNYFQEYIPYMKLESYSYFVYLGLKKSTPSW